MSFFFSFLSFSVFLQIERERERVYNIGYKEKQSQSYLSFFFFFDGYLWRISLLLRANRLYAIFSTGLKKWLLRVRDILFVFFYPEYLALVPSATNPVQQITFLLFISADGKESPLPFQGPSQSFGFSLLPPWPGDPLGLLYVTPYPILFPSGHQVQTSVYPF